MAELPEISIAGEAIAEVVAVPRRAPFDAPWNWLAAGWRDLWAMPAISITYGAVFAGGAVLAALGLTSIGAAALLPAVVGGMLLTGPFVAVGLYDASRRRALGQVPRLGETFLAAVRAPGQLAMFGAFLLFAFMIWMQMALLLLMFFLGDGGMPHPSAFMQTLLFTPRGLMLLIVGTMVGALIAIVVFSSSAVAVAMMLDKPVDAVTAGRASMAAVRANPKPMALWAVLIVCMTAAGFATLMAGFILAFPLIGHATWHAYAEIYGD